MWILSACLCVLLIFIKDCQSDDACIDGGLQQNGSCDFSTDICNYTLSGWKRITGPYKFFLFSKLPGAHSKGGYIVFDYTSHQNSMSIKVASPRLPAGQYNFSFWYVLENKNSVLNVSLQTKTSTKMLWKASRTSPVHTWIPVSLDLDSRQYFQIVFRTSNPVNTVGIDDIRFECKAHSPATTTFAISIETLAPTITQKPNLAIKTEPITPSITMKPILATKTVQITNLITMKSHLATITELIISSITLKPHLVIITEPITPSITMKTHLGTIAEPITHSVTMKTHLVTITEPITPSISMKPHLVTLTEPITPSVTMKPNLVTITEPITPLVTMNPHLVIITEPITPSVTMKPHLVTISEPIIPSVIMKPHLFTITEPITPSVTMKPHLVTITEPISPSVTMKPHLVTTPEPIPPSVTMKPHLAASTATMIRSMTMKPLMVTTTTKTSTDLFTTISTPKIVPTMSLNSLVFTINTAPSMITIKPFVTPTTPRIKQTAVVTTTPTIIQTATMIILPTTTAVTTPTKSSASPTERTMTSIPSKLIALRLEDAIHPGCSSSGWNISVDMPLLRKLYPDIVANNIYFGDNTCRGVEKRTQLLFQEGFRDCLTREQISGGVSVYHNALFYAIYDDVNPFIIRQYKWTFSVECDVSRNEVTSTHIHHDIDAHHSLIMGHHSINMAFFKDPNFMNQISGNPLHAHVGDEVYVKVFTTESDWSVKMRLHTCFTKPTVDSTESTKYYIIKDGCETDSNTHIISQSTHETRFVFQDFVYSTNKEGLNMYCNVTFCDTKDYTVGCTQSCTSKETQALVGK